jgi:hypothetical protein
MDFDDDAPPDLVETTGAEIEEEEKPIKVPITIVTGNQLCYFSTWDCGTDRLHRISWSWKDNPAELHLDGSTWKESSSDHERIWGLYVTFQDIGRTCRTCGI